MKHFDDNMLERIERYLLGNLKPAEQRAFKKEMEADPDLAKMEKEMKKLIGHIKRNKLEEIRQKVRHVAKEYGVSPGNVRKEKEDTPVYELFQRDNSIAASFRAFPMDPEEEDRQLAKRLEQEERRLVRDFYRKHSGK